MKWNIWSCKNAKLVVPPIMETCSMSQAVHIVTRVSLNYILKILFKLAWIFAYFYVKLF